jgi:hypothetical protein
MLLLKGRKVKGCPAASCAPPGMENAFFSTKWCVYGSSDAVKAHGKGWAYVLWTYHLYSFKGACRSTYMPPVDLYVFSVV